MWRLTASSFCQSINFQWQGKPVVWRTSWAAAWRALPCTWPEIVTTANPKKAAQIIPKYVDLTAILFLIAIFIFLLLFRHTRQIDKFLAPAGFLTCVSTRFPTFPAIASGFSGALSAYSRGGGCSFESRYTVDLYCIPIQSPMALPFYGEPLHHPSDHLTFLTSS